MAEEKETKNGRPLKFKSAKELQDKIDEYFESCYDEHWIQDDEGKWKPVYDRNGDIAKIQIKPLTISGLAVHLGTTRRTLLDYEDKDEKFSHTIKQAKAKIENFTEEQLYNSTARNMTGIIFNLKNNYGWQDKQEIDQNIGNKYGEAFKTTTDINTLRMLDPKELEELERILSKTSEA